MKWDARLYDSVKAPQIDAGRELVGLSGIRRTDSVLDLGCGTGRLTLELAHLALEGSVTGIDPSSEMLRKAEERCNARRNISFKRLSAEKMNFRDKFDIVFSNSALQWIKEQETVTGRVYDSLRDGGRIAFQLPAKDFCAEFFEYAWDAVRKNGLESVFEGWESPWYLPAKEEYRDLLKESRFENIKVYERSYNIVFKSAHGVFDWWASAGLRPLLALLKDREKEYFKYSFTMNFEKNRTDKGIEFKFRRIFAFAEKHGR